MKKIKNLLPFAAVFTVASYACTILLQLGYYTQFDVDLLLVTPRVDPTSLVSIVIIVVVLLCALGQYKLITHLKQTPRFLSAAITDGLLLFSLVYSFLKSDSLTGIYGIDLHLNIVYGVVLAVLYGIRLVAASRMYRANERDWKYIYIATSLWKIDKKITRSSGATMTISWTVLIIAVLCINGVLPYVVGSSFALTRTEYTELLIGEQKDPRIRDIVIGQVSDGYIIKKYNEAQKTFENSWMIVRADSLEFQPKSIVSLEMQE